MPWLADGLNYIPLTVPDFDATLDILTFIAWTVTEHIHRCFHAAMPNSSTLMFDQLILDYTCSAWTGAAPAINAKETAA